MFYLSMTSPHCKPAAPPRGCYPGLPSDGPAWPQDVAITDVARAAAGPRVAAVGRALGISPTAVRVGVARLPGRAPTSRPDAGGVGGGEAARAACTSSGSCVPGRSLSPSWTPHEPPAGAARSLRAHTPPVAGAGSRLSPRPPAARGLRSCPPAPGPPHPRRLGSTPQLRPKAPSPRAGTAIQSP